MIGIVDYDRGNLHSVAKALLRLGYEASILREPEAAAVARGLILPGVGAFADAMEALRGKGWIEALQNYVRTGRPFFGICLGMQVLFDVGEEHGEHAGLGFLPGRVTRFGPGVKVPHMGWNNLRLLRENPLCAGVPQNSFFYFVHSYYAAPAEENCRAGVCDYGGEFAALVGRDNIWGTQFHPEKSGRWGLRLLDNFGKWVERGASVSGR
ncbi:MAG: imidazole glycerol phosphate synthase subunit HisH [Gracilibacteraceae bacterium]|jgi:glutamine amidotransferase|nr:imidazole glycerol phosphate synthase subunit HisH [Gracilibacteraceae bacterium]